MGERAPVGGQKVFSGCMLGWEDSEGGKLEPKAAGGNLVARG